MFELDAESRELRKQGVKVRLQEQPFQILQILVEKPGKLVSRDELQRRIWPSDTFVDFDRGLYNAIKKLRSALGDSADSPRFIETISRRGYRFVAVVEADEASSAGDAPTLKRTAITHGWSWQRKIAVGFVLPILAGTLLVVGKRPQWFSGRSAAPQIRSIAVLPLQNLSGDPNQDYFSDGMTDGVITELAQMGSWRVISRTSSMQYKQSNKALPEIARELGVDGIVEGTVQRSGDRVRITAQLIEASTDRHLWARTYERDMQDLFLLEGELAGDIAHEVLMHATTQSQTAVSQPRPVIPKALDDYLQGDYHLRRFSRGSGDDELRQAGDHFEDAIEVDPNFALAYVGLSSAHGATLQSSREDIEIARKAVQKALQLDPGLSDAWEMLGAMKTNSWDWTGAEEDLRRAIALNPNSAPAHVDLGFLLDDVGRLDEGWKEYQIAQQLDPHQDHLEYAYYKRQEYDEAIEAVLRMLGGDPNNGYLHHKLYETYIAKRMYKEAVQQLEQVVTLFGFPEEEVKLRQAYSASGYTGAMREYARELEYLNTTHQVFMPVNIAAVYAALGNKDRAFYWLEEGYKQRGHQSAGVPFSDVSVYRGLDPLRSDPRFKDLLHRMGLPEVPVGDSVRTPLVSDSGSLDRQH